MKTYLLDTIDRFKRYSQKLDVQTVLCSKAWYVLNEDGDTENLIFQPDGTVLVSVNGSIKKCTWQYIPQNRSISIMHTESEGTMLKATFIDGTVLAFNKSGTNECMFLIDNTLDNEHKMQSLEAVKKYLLFVEKKALDKQKHKEAKKLKKAQKKEEEQKKAAEEAERMRRADEMQREKIKEEKNRIEEEYYYKVHKLQNDYDYTYISKWYEILDCKDKQQRFWIFNWSFFVFWLVPSFMCLALFMILGMKVLAVIILVSLFPIGYLAIPFEKWRHYKHATKLHNQYAAQHKEFIDSFNYHIFYEIKNDYEEYSKKFEKLNTEKENALKKLNY